MLLIPSFDNSDCGVSSPVLTPLRLAPVILPADTILEGVISPSPRLNTPAAVIVLPVTTIPPLPTTPTLVTVPALAVYPAGLAAS